MMMMILKLRLEIQSPLRRFRVEGFTWVASMEPGPQKAIFNGQIRMEI